MKHEINSGKQTRFRNKPGFWLILAWIFTGIFGIAFLVSIYEAFN